MGNLSYFFDMFWWNNQKFRTKFWGVSPICLDTKAFKGMFKFDISQEVFSYSPGSVKMKGGGGERGFGQWMLKCVMPVIDYL